MNRRLLDSRFLQVSLQIHNFLCFRLHDEKMHHRHFAGGSIDDLVKVISRHLHIEAMAALDYVSGSVEGYTDVAVWITWRRTFTFISLFSFAW